MFPLQKLQVYSQALALAQLVRSHCGAMRDVDLRRQLLRSVRAIAANLAEGAGSQSQAVFARYIAISVASAKETECHLHIAHQSNLLSSAEVDSLRLALDNLTPRLVRLLAAVRENAKRRIKDAP